MIAPAKGERCRKQKLESDSHLPQALTQIFSEMSCDLEPIFLLPPCLFLSSVTISWLHVKILFTCKKILFSVAVVHQLCWTRFFSFRLFLFLYRSSFKCGETVDKPNCAVTQSDRVNCFVDTYCTKSRHFHLFPGLYDYTVLVLRSSTAVGRGCILAMWSTNDLDVSFLALSRSIPSTSL